MWNYFKRTLIIHNYMLHSLHQTPTIVLKSQMAGHVTGVQDTRNKFEI